MPATISQEKKIERDAISIGTSEKAPAGDLVDELYAFLQKYSSSNSFKELRQAIQETSDIRKKLNELNIAYVTNLEHLNKRDNEFQEETAQYKKAVAAVGEQLKQATKDMSLASQNLDYERSKLETSNTLNKSQAAEIKGLQYELNKQNKRIKELEAIEAEKDRLKDELGAMAKDVKEKGAELNQVHNNMSTIQAFVVKLESLYTREDEITTILNNIFKEAYDLINAFLGTDLDEDRLQDVTAWESMRNQHGIPLPLTNTLPARRMRVAAGLVIYANVLARHIWRPAYITRSDEIDQFLLALEMQNALQESYVRAVLLKALPEKQEFCRDKCLDKVSVDMLESIGDVLPVEKRQEFASRLTVASRNICNQWTSIQGLEEKVKFSFSSVDINTGYTLPSHPSPANSKPSAAKGQPPKAQLRHPNHQPASKGSSTGDAIVKILWPSFFYTDPHERGVLLRDGCILTQAQSKDAEDEVSQRGARRIRRQSESSGKRQNSGNLFLHVGGPNGSDVK